jgi:hypothetical protein
LTPTFTAPADITTNTVLSFSFTITDNSGLTGTDTVDITVTPIASPTLPPAIPPTANAGPDQTVEAGTPVTLDGTASSDSDGTISSYSWVEITGYPNLVINGNDTITPTLTAPSDITNDTVISFGLTVTDDANLTSTDTVDMTVKPPQAAPAIPPTSNAGQDQTVEAGTPVTLDGTASSDSDGTISSYNWTELTGYPNITISGNDTPTPTFNAPSNISETVPLIFELTVTDNQNLSNTDAVDLTVNAEPAKAPPVANAGDNQTVSAGQKVSLDGSQSLDSDGTIQSFSWKQIEGTPSVSLANSETSTASFTAPDVSANSSLVFQLTVTDIDGLTGQDGVIITVTSPMPDAENDGILFEVDPEPNTSSVVFSDQRAGGTTVTNGTIIDKGNQSLTIRDVPDNPNKGVRITAGQGGGASPARVEACGGIYSLNSGDEIVVTCGSAEVEVSKGEITAEFSTPDKTKGVSELSQGNTLEFDSDDNSLSAPSTNSQPIEVGVQTPEGSGELTIAPGGSAELEIPSPSPPPPPPTTTAPPPTTSTGDTPTPASPTSAPPPTPASPTAPGGGGAASQPPAGGGGASGGGAGGGGGGAAPKPPAGGGGAASQPPAGGGGAAAPSPKPPTLTPKGTPSPLLSPGATPKPTPGGPNQPPTVNIQVPGSAPGLRQPVVSAGSLVVMDGSLSKDPNPGDVLKFSWKQEQSGASRAAGASPTPSPTPSPTASPAPTVQLQGANTPKASFVAPKVTKPTLLSFSLTVDDGKGGKNTRPISIGIRPGGGPQAGNQTGNITLVANAGPDQSVKPNQTVTLDGSASRSIDPKAKLGFIWIQAKGPQKITPINGSKTSEATFKAPNKDGIYTFALQVSDDKRHRAADRVNVTVTSPPPAKPTPPKAEGLSPLMLYGLIGGVAAGAAVAALWFFKLRHRGPAKGGEDKFVP